MESTSTVCEQKHPLLNDLILGNVFNIIADDWETSEALKTILVCRLVCNSWEVLARKKVPCIMKALRLERHDLSKEDGFKICDWMFPMIAQSNLDFQPPNFKISELIKMSLEENEFTNNLIQNVQIVESMITELDNGSFKPNTEHCVFDVLAYFLLKSFLTCLANNSAAKKKKYTNRVMATIQYKSEKCEKLLLTAFEFSVDIFSERKWIKNQQLMMLESIFQIFETLLAGRTMLPVLREKFETKLENIILKDGLFIVINRCSIEPVVWIVPSFGLQSKSFTCTKMNKNRIVKYLREQLPIFVAESTIQKFLFDYDVKVESFENVAKLLEEQESLIF